MSLKGQDIGGSLASPAGVCLSPLAPPPKELSRPAGHGTSTAFAGHSSVCSHVAGGGTTEPRASRMASGSPTKSEPTRCKTTGPAAVHGHIRANAEGPRRGKAPPVDSFSGEVTFDDWYPSLQRAAHWNQWTDQDTLIQLAGHLRGRALQEWTLLRETEKGTLGDAVTSL